VQRVHVIGRKNSGKTTLIVELVQILTVRGCRIATIKHTHHHHELDTPGKDSHRHRTAGAAAVGILSPGMNAVFWPPKPNQDGTGRYEEISAAFRECDLVLVEGDTQATAPKVEVWRAAAGAPPFAVEDASIFALITDDAIDFRIRVWKRSDVAALADHLLELGVAGHSGDGR
jgi:molybdopterin-guanine dinucleotide biosynthesis protein MobB